MGSAMAAPPVLDVTRIGPQPAALTNYFGVLIDPTAALTLAEVSAPAMSPRFVAGQYAGDAIGLSYTRSAVWLCLHLSNPGDQPVERVLEIAYALLANVEVYQRVATAEVGPGGRNAASAAGPTRLGYRQPLASAPHASRFLVLPVSIPAHSEQTLFMRFTTPNSMNIPAKLWDPKAFTVHERTEYAVQALYFGVLLGLLVYNLMLFIALRDVSFLLYCAFSACVALAMAGFTGIGRAHLWGDWSHWSMVCVNLCSAVAGVSMLMFARRVLGTAKLMPRLDRAMTLLMVLNALSVPLLWGWFDEVTPVFVVLSAFTSLFLLVTGLLCATRRHRSAYFFVAAFAVILIAVVLAHLRNHGLLPTNLLTSDGTQIGSVLEMLLLSFALADRYNAMRRENMRSQAQTLAIQGELVRSLQASEQALEARVAERTAELQLLNSKLQTISITDGLTRLANRRHFDTVLASEWARAQRLAQPLSIGLADVDWFKLYNDRYGHQAGDECLRRVASALGGSICRTGDLVARYGGEEFIFIAPNTDAASALAMARRAAEAIEALALPHLGSAFGVVTVSVGVASFVPGGGQTPDDLIQAADMALYKAKEQGRNQVQVAKG